MRCPIFSHFTRVGMAKLAGGGFCWVVIFLKPEFQELDTYRKLCSYILIIRKHPLYINIQIKRKYDRCRLLLSNLTGV